MKKFATILLVLTLLLSLVVPAFAESTKNDSITITNAKVGETYNLYKMFDLAVNSEIDPTAYTYKVNSDWAAFFAAANGDQPAGSGFQYVTIEAGVVTAISNAADLAEAAAAWTGKPTTATQTITATGETVVFNSLENGYWLITSTLGTIAMTETTPDKAAVSVDEKNVLDTITKQVQEDSTSAWGTTNDAQIGDVINYESKVTLKKGTRNVKVTDTMEDGLTYSKNATIAGLTKDTDYTIEENNQGFTITFKETYLKKLSTETTLTLTYTAVLNENAIKVTGDEVKTVEIKDQANNIVLTYGNSQTLTMSTKTTTHKFNVFKHAKDSTANLAGAVFSLKKNGTVVNLVKIDDNNYRVAKTTETGAVATFTTVDKGDIVIWGVDADADYALEEITAPAGYNKLTADVSVDVDADNATRVDVENMTGSELPSTGGMGTTLFYVLGGILVMAAVVLLVTKKRMANTQ